MDWKKKVNRGFNRGIDHSKILFKKAKSQALDLGERTLLETEIKELNKKKIELFSTLGEEIYSLLVNIGRSSVSMRTPEIRDIFPELEKLITDLAVKQMLVDKDKKDSK